MFNQTRITLFLYLEATGEYRRITPEDYDVNHVNVRPGQVLFTAFPFRDVKPVTEGMYRWDAERNETETLITPDKYSIDYVGHLGRKALCLGLVMRDYGVYEHPTFFVVDENGEVHRIGCPKGKVVNSVGAGDSMVAGFVAGYLKTGRYDDALRLGTACGSATAFSLGLAKRSEIEALLAAL